MYNNGKRKTGKTLKKPIVGILAHVDAGKTTLSEALLYNSGMIRNMGRVDHQDTFLDNYELEKKRGITIFSKLARMKFLDVDMTLVDTPGHVDFSAETERALQVLDYAILVISATDGVQAHTRTLFRLLMDYQVPTFLFVNKMDLACKEDEVQATTGLMAQLKEELHEGMTDFTSICGDSQEKWNAAAVEEIAGSDEEAMSSIWKLEK